METSVENGPAADAHRTWGRCAQSDHSVVSNFLQPKEVSFWHTCRFAASRQVGGNRRLSGRSRGATELKNPDFAAYARAFGGFGATVERTADFAAAYDAAVKSGKPAIVHLKVDPEAATPTMSLTAIREKALAGRS